MEAERASSRPTRCCRLHSRSEHERILTTDTRTRSTYVCAGRQTVPHEQEQKDNRISTGSEMSHQRYTRGGGRTQHWMQLEDRVVGDGRRYGAPATRRASKIWISCYPGCPRNAEFESNYSKYIPTTQQILGMRYAAVAECSFGPEFGVERCSGRGVRLVVSVCSVGVCFTTKSGARALSRTQYRLSSKGSSTLFCGVGLKTLHHRTRLLRTGCRFF